MESTPHQQINTKYKARLSLRFDSFNIDKEQATITLRMALCAAALLTFGGGLLALLTPLNTAIKRVSSARRSLKARGAGSGAAVMSRLAAAAATSMTQQ